MSAATTAATDAKPTSKTKSRSRRARANRRNSSKSTGPRTAAGKDKSRHNALKHGMTARSALLPGEDASALAARRREMLDDMQPRNSLEATLLVQIADDAWITNRCQEAALTQASFRIRHEPLDQTCAEKDQALELGEHLLFRPARPLPGTPIGNTWELTEPPAADVAVHPRHPARVLLRLERTIPGCDWLLERWRALMERLNVDRAWRPLFAFQMVRLTGQRAIDMEENFDVTRMLLSSLMLIAPPNAAAQEQPIEWATALTKMMTSFDVESDIMSMHHMANQCRAFTVRMAELPLVRMAPQDDVQARQGLTAVIEAEMERVGQIRAVLQKIADADAAEAPARLAIGRGPEVENDRRYLLSSKRVLNQSIGKFLNARKMSEDGALGPVDLDPIDRFNPDEPNDRNCRPWATSPDNNGNSRDGEALPEPALALGSHGGSPSRIVPLAPARNNDSPGRIGESWDGEAVINGLMRGENTVQQTPDGAPRVDVSANTPAPILETEKSCDDDQILRNEAIESVSGPRSVVRCEVATSGEPDVASAAPQENLAFEPISTATAILMPASFYAARERERPCEPNADAGPDKSATSAYRHARKTRTQRRLETSNAERDLDAIINAIFDAHRPREPNP